MEVGSFQIEWDIRLNGKAKRYMSGISRYLSVLTQRILVRSITVCSGLASEIPQPILLLLNTSDTSAMQQITKNEFPYFRIMYISSKKELFNTYINNAISLFGR